ncbi:conserved hypothetical protein [Catenulispora acidiphila DSM 44928]|uniref:DinB-like domain-containing protein n=1 Tax=Catenulispora acidiphila (strain DSM 44928 / JCM 14897 / NBRC 102108 / NRRL B-24433 / ID139908) TaxID=479433 RepID=C7PWC4_CATAD|nr:DinB family protein [Catenulispora acidiphila]ACU73372.1 conserved hypothetical protein [Catenulispora acidiphila DSM 44928]
MASHDPVTSDLLQTFEEVRSRTFARLEGLTDAEYQWQPVADCMTVRPTEDGVFRADARLPDSGASGRSSGSTSPTPVTTIAWRMWHIGSDCLRDYLGFFDKVPDLGDRYAWPGTADLGILAMEEDWARFATRVEALGDARLLAPMGEHAEAQGYAEASYLALVLHALDEVAHHGGEIGLMRDLYLRQGGRA